MKTADIREMFLRFFAARGHARVASSPLVPAGDRTLLFTNSGMVQFKDVFLGFDKRPYDKAVTVQRCLRAGGKHNDLENVGYTARHHTFFEMLGNFSFGDYFKEKAIPYAWEFLTSPEWLGLKKEHLWVTVFGGGKVFGDGGGDVPADDDAAALWRRTLVGAGFSEAEAARRITRICSTDNFWMMGDTGPCGPCSEIFYDRDAGAREFRGTDEAHADTCVEVWNLVFMQYNRDDDGVLHNLPAPCVDTGMGLERIATVMQGVQSNYDIDLFADLLREVKKAANVSEDYSPPPPPIVFYPASPRVVADHIRAAAFLIADGVLPGNEGRGYVLRRIIRRALRHLHQIRETENAAFAALVAPLADLMGDAYPELREKQSIITDALRQEENGFSSMLKNGLNMLAGIIEFGDLSDGVLTPEGKLPGDIVFKLYDTYGFPPDMTESIARDGGMDIDHAGFERCMREQRERSRAAAKFKVGQKTVVYDGAATEFTGYERLQDEAVITGIFIGGEAADEAAPGAEAVIVLNRTPFYAESGGQVGDSGALETGGGGAQVSDTQKIRADVWGHIARVGEGGGALRVGDVAQCRVDAPRRAAIARNHSAAHLMHAALRRVLGAHVQQRGSQVAEGALRFDFSHAQAVSAGELRDIEALVNAQIAANSAAETRVMDYDDALKTGAMALFGEKYGARVRVVTLDADFSVELCGGTHTARAGDIGLFRFTGESAIAAGVRRVEAVTGGVAVAQMQTLRARLSDMAAMLKAPEERLEEKIRQLRDSLKAAQKETEELRAAHLRAEAKRLAAAAEDIGGRRVLLRHIAGADGKTLRQTAMLLKDELPAPAAVFLAGDGGGQASLIAVSSDKSLGAKEWLRDAAAAAGAKGGGKADFAQAGGGDASKTAAALAAARAYLAG